MTANKVHPAVEFIVEAETRPVFAHAAAPVLELLENALKAGDDGLHPRWIARRELRGAYVLMQSKNYGAAEKNLKAALRQVDEHGLGPYLRARHRILAARLSTRTSKSASSSPVHGELSGGYVSRLSGLDVVESASLETVAAIALAEDAVSRSHYAPIVSLLESHVHVEGAFSSVDDLWQALQLLALAYLVNLQPDAAAAILTSLAEICAIHDAPADRADVLAALGNAEVLAGRTEAGVAALDEAANTAEELGLVESEGQRRMMLTTSRYADGDVEGAIAEAERAAVLAAERDDYVAYVTMVGIITALYLNESRAKDAYRNLLHIASSINARLGQDAARPFVGMIERLRDTVGEKEFEEIAAELLSEMKEAAQ